MISSVLRRERSAYLFILPSILLVFGLTLYPILYAVRFSFFKSVVLVPVKFIGLENYVAVIAQPSIRTNFFASFEFVLGSMVLSIGLGLALALIINRGGPLSLTARTLIFVPWVTSQMASALLWRWLINPDYGPLVHALQKIGLARIDFLGSPTLAMVTLVLANTWRSVAFSMIVLLAALQAIPETVTSAVAVDGPSPWQHLREVILPLIAPSLLLCVIISSLGYFNNIVFPLILTGGGPVNATELVTLRLYREAFSYYHMGFASALAVAIFLVNLLLTLAYLRSIRVRSYY